MAVFPDRIVLKSSTETPANIISLIGPNGTSEIIPGELVISRQSGTANIYTVDADGNIVSASVPNLSGLLDVDLSGSVADGSVLFYNATTGKWEDTAAPPYDISGNDLGDLGDVNISASPVANSFLYWDQTAGEWQEGTFTVHQLPGVSGTPGTSGQVVRWDNTEAIDTSGPVGWTVQQLEYTDIQNRPTSVSDLTVDISIQDLNDTNLTGPAVGDLITWDGTEWVTAAAPPINLSGGTLTQIGDVTEVSVVTGAVPRYNETTSEYEIQKLEYSDINNRPTAVSDLSKDVGVSYWANDAGYITSTAGLDLDALGDVTLTSSQEGQMLIYRSGVWVNEFGPPANISFSSIGELSDVTYVQPGTDPGVLTVENLGEFVFDSPSLGSGFTQKMKSDLEYGLGFSSFRDSDLTGSAVWADRGRGVTLRSDVNFVRITGRPDITTNRPEVRFETGDDGAATPTGEYIGFKMPSVVSESVTYYLPSADGDAGDVLTTDGSGGLVWSTQGGVINLGDLNDVDTATIPPSDGSGLIYNATTGQWMVGAVSSVDLSSSSINELADVDTSTSQPTDGQALVWSQANGNWEPGTVDSPVTEVNEQTGSVYLGITDMIDYEDDGYRFTTHVTASRTTDSTGVGDSWSTFSDNLDGLDRKFYLITHLIDGTNLSDDFAAWFVGDTIDVFVGGTFIGSDQLIYVDNSPSDGNFLFRFSDNNTDAIWDALQSHLSGELQLINRAFASYRHPDPTDGDYLRYNAANLTFDRHKPTLSELQDIDFTTTPPVDGQFLSYDAAASNWAPSGIALDDLDDVNAPSPTDGQTLVWDAAASEWITGDGGGDVQSVNGETGAVSLGIQDMNDFQLEDDPAKQSTPTFNTNWSWFGVTSSASTNHQPGNFATSISNWWISPYNQEGDYLRDTLRLWVATLTVGETIVLDLDGVLTNYTYDGVNDQMDSSGTYRPRLSFNGAISGTPNGEDVTKFRIRSFEQWAVDNGYATAIYEEAPLTEGDVLRWNDTDSKFKPTFLSTVASTGDFNDLTNIPTSLPGAGTTSKHVSDTFTTDATGEATLTTIGSWGCLIGMSAVTDTWVCIYHSAAARTADRNRAFSNDPPPSAGVLAEFFLTGGTLVVASPGATYFNSADPPVSEIYVLTRDVNGSGIASTCTIRVNGFTV